MVRWKRGSGRSESTVAAGLQSCSQREGVGLQVARGSGRRPRSNGRLGSPRAQITTSAASSGSLFSSSTPGAFAHREHRGGRPALSFGLRHACAAASHPFEARISKVSNSYLLFKEGLALRTAIDQNCERAEDYLFTAACALYEGKGLKWNSGEKLLGKTRFPSQPLPNSISLYLLALLNRINPLD